MTPTHIVVNLGFSLIGLWRTQPCSQYLFQENLWSIKVNGCANFVVTQYTDTMRVLIALYLYSTRVHTDTVITSQRRPIRPWLKHYYTFKGLEWLDKNIDTLSPGFSIKPEVCLTIQPLQAPDLYSAGIFHGLSDSMKESLKRAIKWLAYYFTNADSYY